MAATTPSDARDPASSAALGARGVRKGGAFRIGLRAAPVTLNPLAAQDHYVDRVMWWIAEPLLLRDPDTYEFIPALAASYKADPDGKTFEFTLRKGVRFHAFEGAPEREMTVEDVRFSFEAHRLRLYPTSLRLADIEEFESVEAAGPDRVRFRFKAPRFSNLQRIAAFPIVPKAFYEKPRPGLNLTAIGTGPYRVKSHRVGERLTLERNPDWWGAKLPENARKHNFDEIVVRFLPDASRELQMIKSGDLDWVELSTEHYLRALAEDSVAFKALIGEATPLESRGWQHSVFLNLDDPLFGDLKTRRALQALLDRQALNRTLFGGLAKPATGPWNSLSEYADPGVKPARFSRTEASRWLREAGWADRDGDGVLERIDADGRQRDFRFVVLYATPVWEKILSIYQQELKRAGIEISLRLVDWAILMKSLDERTFEAALLGTAASDKIDFNPRPSWHSEFVKKGYHNAIAFRDARADALLDRFERSANRRSRIAILRQAYRAIAERQPAIWLFNHPVAYFARSPRLKMERAAYRYLWAVDYWWVEEAAQETAAPASDSRAAHGL